MVIIVIVIVIHLVIVIMKFKIRGDRYNDAKEGVDADIAGGSAENDNEEHDRTH